MKRRTTIGLGIAVLAGLAVASASPRLHVPSANAAPRPIAPAAPHVAPAPERSFVGVILAPQMANLSSRADGRLVSVNVRVGQTVHKDDALAVFDQRDRRQDLALAEAQLKTAMGAAAAAGADLGAARARAARRNATVDIGGGKRIAVVSGEEAAQATADAHGAAGRAASAAGQIAEQKARIGSLKIALEETTLRAPFDGVITATNFEGGMSVHAHETVVRVVGGSDMLRLRVAVPEEDATLVRTGTVVRFKLEDGRALTARLTHVSPEVDPSTRCLFVEGDVDLHADDRQIALLSGRRVSVVVAR
jgi:RND family efflux transporter MFP subunit